MSTSILDVTKAALGVTDNDFDTELKMHINSTLGTLIQLGLGPEDWTPVTGSGENWEAFLGPENVTELDSAQSYMFICVKMMFDPMTIPGPVLTMFQEQKREFEWRLFVAADPPLPPFNDDDDDDEYGPLILDGGMP